MFDPEYYIVKLVVNLINKSTSMPKDVILQRNGEDVFPVTRYQNILDRPEVVKSLGIPIVTPEILENLREGEVPDDYVLIQEETLENTDSDNTVQILFSAIRKLQAEVAKLRNSFRYGITSYTGTDTATSQIVSEYSDIDEDEPLWSIEEDELSEISDATVDFEEPFIPFTSEDRIAYDQTGYAQFIGTAFTNNVVKQAYSEIDDTKIFAYLTVDEPNVKVHLITGDETQLNIDLSTLLTYRPTSERYNICILVSRKMSLDDGENEYGKNYVWISIGYFNTNTIIAEGYYNPTNHSLQKQLFELNDKYTFDSIEFSQLNIYKFNAYSKYQDFTHEIIQSSPSDSDYKYKAAHITIRSVSSIEELQAIQDRLLQDELVFQEDKKILWINGKNGLSSIGGSNSIIDNGMTEQEMIEKLQELGIVYVDQNGLQISDVSDITFINNDTGKRFKFGVNSEGELKSSELPQRTLAERISVLAGSGHAISEQSEIRGFVAKLFASENNANPTATSDIKLNSDRVKIGAVYCPRIGNTKYGCSHGFIELENTSDKDFPLSGCYLHYLHPNETNSAQLDVEHLALEGVIPAGSTYLIRCKQYADPKLDADVFINVDSYDKEWYINGELLDLSNNGTSPYAFALTYGDKVGGQNITASTVFITENAANAKAPLFYVWNYIDSLLLNAHPSAVSGTWAPSYVTVDLPNMIIRNTFELDPAKQAYQALNKYDSSRYRGENANDIQKLDLTEEFIAFPNSEDECAVAVFAPKASYLKKNVSTDKTKLNKEKPNMVTCSFGIDIYKTRTFNWISAGEFDEYVWIKDGNNWLKFESYKEGDGNETPSEGFPRRKEFSDVVINTIYKRIIGDFPGDGSHYTSHKCIIQLVNTAVQEPTTYTYIVGKADRLGGPDLEHCSDEHTFTLYPTSYTPRIYQTTDQQGFHWIEYQAWTAAADKLNEKIVADCSSENIIPILLNTGDMTQNGTRINEWLDYYNAGRSLFSHLEQMNVVGNNDLCNTNVRILGTGDDTGKSNGYYFHVFYCYEVDPENLPIITGDDSVDRYVPSLYYFDANSYRYVMINSELTYENCNNWFKKHKNGQVVNVYTGWAVSGDGTVPSTGYLNDFTTVYTMIYDMINGANGKNVIAVCHEMPFTVITKDSLSNVESVYQNYRSLSGAGTSLVGSHTNQLNGNDRIATHWLSRLLEHFGVKLCIGGHKHTYACTYPVRENYYYMDNGTKVNSSTAKMTMARTLEHDDEVEWFDDNGHNTSKLPYVPSGLANDASEAATNNLFSPATVDANVTGGVTYFMCQATGYKLTSNKELPSNCQHFSVLIPQTGKKSNGDDSADGNQQYPMFSIIDMSGNNYEIQLIRIKNIKNDSGKHEFTQQLYGKGTPSFEWAVGSNSSRYCTWSSTKTTIISI